MDPTDMSMAEVQDDPVAEAVHRLRRTPPDRQHLPRLTDKTFPSLTTSSDFLMVLFYLTCTTCITWISSR